MGHQSMKLSIKTPTLYNGSFVCSGDKVTFVCETRGSSTIAWSSEEYIGPGGAQLVFPAIGIPSLTNPMRGIGDTIATFTVNKLEGGVQVLQSTLRVTAMSMYPNPLVKCIHGDESSRAANFSVIGKYRSSSGLHTGVV